MYKKMVIALFLLGSLVMGITSFSGSLAQASPNCGSDSAILAANPELAVACRYHDTMTGSQTAASGAIEASVVRRPDLTNSTSLAVNPELFKAHRPIIAAEVSESTFLANNPELMIARRDILPENKVDPDNDLGLLEFFTGSDETNGPQAIQRDANEDIGLLEFFKP